MLVHRSDNEPDNFILASAGMKLEPGDRAIAQAHDHEVAFAIPRNNIEIIAEGLEGTHKAGMRYPTPALLPLGVALPPSFDELMDYLRQGS
ncbi:MAG TPA: hypothetical protein VMW64_06655 [Dehalococcoidia bacterium]|nr:hypothetical protein [Dehalococcoidia bacterium]